jgi:hypothetical protein
VGISYHRQYTRRQNVTGDGKGCEKEYTHNCQRTTVQLVQYVYVAIFLIEVASRLRKANVFAASRLFVHTELSPHGMDPRDILCWEIFTKICRIEVLVKI